ncbi:MAG TPA: hypothetical protein VHM88_24465 [Candidatus Acidoferrales bacterium]|jgi:hypothetical protein|nr:hypothetical protein [Candidatus Acidoferrales bacterium]
MTIHFRGDWYYDHNIALYEGKFLWHVVRFKIANGFAVGTWVAGGVNKTREEAERNGLAAIKADAPRGEG